MELPNLGAQTSVFRQLKLLDSTGASGSQRLTLEDCVARSAEEQGFEGGLKSHSSVLPVANKEQPVMTSRSEKTECWLYLLV